MAYSQTTKCSGSEKVASVQVCVQKHNNIQVKSKLEWHGTIVEAMLWSVKASDPGQRSVPHARQRAHHGGGRRGLPAGVRIVVAGGGHVLGGGRQGLLAYVA